VKVHVRARLQRSEICLNGWNAYMQTSRMIGDCCEDLILWLADDLMIGGCGIKAENEIHRRLRHALWPQLQAPSGA
jgi:hypothetical protein